MTYTFPSDEWLQQFKDALNGEPGKAWQEAAAEWEGSFLFVVESDATLSETVYLFIDLWHGQCRTVSFHKEGDTLPEADAQFKGAYGNWVKLLKGEIDLIKGMLMRKFKLAGNKGKVMRGAQAAKELVATAKSLDTVFLQ